MRKLLITTMMLLAFGFVANAQSRYNENTQFDELVPGDKAHKDSIYWLINEVDKDAASLCVYYRKAASCEIMADKKGARENYRKAYEIWKYVFAEAPLADRKALITKARKMLEFLISNAQDNEKLVEYENSLNDLLDCCERHAEDFIAMAKEEDRKVVIAEFKNHLAYKQYLESKRIYQEAVRVRNIEREEK